MTAAPPTALFEAHLTVADLERSAAFYSDVVGLSLAYRLPERGAVFFWIGGRGRSMLGLWSNGSAPMAVRLHVAFGASLDDVLAAGGRLRAAGVTPLSFFGTAAAEPSVIAWMPAAAVYFEDPDGHMIEYLAMLDDPPRPEAGIVPWSQWRRGRSDAVEVTVHSGSRTELRGLFEEAEDSASELDAYIDDGEVLVAIAGGRVLGHLQLTTQGDRGEIKNMAVVAEHRGRGIGRRLVEAALARAGRRRLTAVVVATAAADVGNLRFYQRCGFRLRAVDRDAFTPAGGYPRRIVIDGIELRDRVWLDLELSSHGGTAAPGRAGGR
jgi:ribosomal protein S18 acetylase RimI-like enzyme/catechol 2,3-dioxygenase-like lactoylglutathione lyase family enzyme